MHSLEEHIFYLFSFIPLSPGVVLPFVITFSFYVLCALFNKKAIKNPQSKARQWVEYIYEYLNNFVEGIVGEGLKKELMPILSTVFIFIFCSNAMGVVPGLKSPTSLFSSCLSMALLVFFLTFYVGFKAHGLGYIKHYTGDVWWMAPLMVPLHLVSELSRPLSLTLRLFGNIMGEDTVILVLTVALFPLLVPVPMLILSLLTSAIQAMVYTILTGVYLSGALSEGH